MFKKSRSKSTYKKLFFINSFSTMDLLTTHDDPDQSKMIDQDAITALGLKASQNHSAANVGLHLLPSGDYGPLVHQDHGSLFSPLPVLNQFSQLSDDLNILAHPEWVLL
jgi:hypothetical protein